jgi:hypothetical protein
VVPGILVLIFFWILPNDSVAWETQYLHNSAQARVQERTLPLETTVYIQHKRDSYQLQAHAELAYSKVPGVTSDGGRGYSTSLDSYYPPQAEQSSVS